MLMSRGPAGVLAHMEILESWLIVDLYPRLCPVLSVWLQGSGCLSCVSHLEHERACCSAVQLVLPVPFPWLSCGVSEAWANNKPFQTTTLHPQSGPR